MHVACQKSCLFADRAAEDSSLPDEAAARLRKQGRVRICQHQCHYSAIELRNKSGVIVGRFVAFAVNTIFGGPVCIYSVLEVVPSSRAEIQQLL